MYESYYGLSARPFQLRPDARFFFDSRNHKRALAYLQYGLSQGEGFIVVTGEVGAGKTTLMRNLLGQLDSARIVAAQISNTHLDSDDMLRMVAAAFELDFEGGGKTALLTRIERFLRDCDRQGKRALLIVDEAQNLSRNALEELRMLSNFQTLDNALLQTFLLGQPEFRKTLLRPDMQQLRQRVSATYHLGPMDADETRQYVEHRLRTAGWNGDPALVEDIFAGIHVFTGGIPRRINTLCDRLFLMGYLEELHRFERKDVDAVIEDIRQELDGSGSAAAATSAPAPAPSDATVALLLERLGKMERAMQFIVDALSKLLFTPKPHNLQEDSYP